MLEAQRSGGGRDRMGIWGTQKQKQCQSQEAWT